MLEFVQASCTTSQAEQLQIGKALVCEQGYHVLQVGIWIQGQADKMERVVEKAEQASFLGGC